MLSLIYSPTTESNEMTVLNPLSPGIWEHSATKCPQLTKAPNASLSPAEGSSSCGQFDLSTCHLPPGKWKWLTEVVCWMTWFNSETKEYPTAWKCCGSREPACEEMLSNPHVIPFIHSKMHHPHDCHQRTPANTFAGGGNGKKWWLLSDVVGSVNSDTCMSDHSYFSMPIYSHLAWTMFFLHKK